MPALIILACIVFLGLMFGVFRLLDPKRESRGDFLDVLTVILVSIAFAFTVVLLFIIFYLTSENGLRGTLDGLFFSLIVFVISFLIFCSTGTALILRAPKSKLPQNKDGDD